MSMKHTNKKLIFIGRIHTTLQQNVTITNFNKSTTLDYLDMLRVNATEAIAFIQCRRAHNEKHPTE